MLALGVWVSLSLPCFAQDENLTELNQRTSSLFAEGKYQEAIPIAERAVDVAKRARGSEDLETADALNNLGRLYKKVGDYAKAEPLYKEALRIRQKVLGPENVSTATSLNNLGLLYNDLREYAKAEPLLKEALRVYQKVLAKDDPYTATSLDNLARLYRVVGDYVKAEPLLQEALRIRQKSLGSEHPDTAVSLNNLGELYETMGEYAKAEPLYQEALQIWRKIFGPEHRETANGLNNLALLYRAMGEYAKAEPVLREALAIRQKVLGSENADTAASLNNLAILYWAMREYAKAEPLYGAIVLFPKGAPRWIPLAKINELEHLVRRYGILVRGSPQEEEISANLQALYETLWVPIERALPRQTKRIIISPDGELNFISFATLLTQDKQFLAQKYDIQYVSSGRDLLREIKPSAAKDVVLFANPDFSLSSTATLAKAGDPPYTVSLRGSEKRDVEDWSFEDLTGTQTECNELSKKFTAWGWTTADFTAKKATKEALLKIQSPYILHLATHGFFAKEDSTASEAESPLNDQRGVTKSKFFKNPMHRSGLALAGAQTTIQAWKHADVPPVENDGILTAEDVSTLDLKGTWLVTLSACHTGSGEARAGEGVMGLRRGFIQAGAQNLLMTLWPISDEVTVQIMSDFYDAAHNSGNAPEALAEVQRNWLVKLRTGKGLAESVRLAGPFIMSSQGKPIW